MGSDAALALQEAEILLSRLRDPKPDSPKPSRIRIEKVCQRLLRHFQETWERRHFHYFYHLSRENLTAYAARHLTRYNCPLEPDDVLNQMYIILFEKLQAPGESVPWDFLFPWCYKVILNLVREESRNLRRAQPLYADKVKDRTAPSLMDQLARDEQESERQVRIERILDILYSSRGGLSSRNRTVMRLFYLEGRSIKEISSQVNLKREHVGVILMRTRNRIARHLGVQDPHRFEEEK